MQRAEQRAHVDVVVVDGYLGAVGVLAIVWGSTGALGGSGSGSGPSGTSWPLPVGQSRDRR